MNYFNPFVFYSEVLWQHLTNWYAAAGWFALVLIFLAVALLIFSYLKLFFKQDDMAKRTYLCLGTLAVVTYSAFTMLAIKL